MKQEEIHPGQLALLSSEDGQNAAKVAQQVEHYQRRQDREFEMLVMRLLIEALWCVRHCEQQVVD